MIKMKLVEITLNTKENFNDKASEALRGYFGNHFKKIIDFHNHMDDEKVQYSFSYIQYRVIKGKLSLLGIDRGADILLENISKIKNITLNDKEYIVEPEVKITFPEIKITRNFQKYKFETPWFALNQDNFKKYKNGELLLSIQLRNNIIEFFKMCGVRAEEEICVEGNFIPHYIYVKKTKILAFTGSFLANVSLPNNITLGKRKSIGLGRIVKCEDSE